jgi:hypothetical protein
LIHINYHVRLGLLLHAANGQGAISCSQEGVLAQLSNEKKTKERRMINADAKRNRKIARSLRKLQEILLVGVL